MQADRTLDLRLRTLAVPGDIALIHSWFVMPYATYWGMQNQSQAQTQEAYAAMMASGHAKAYMGLADGVPAFIVECYDPAFDPLAAHYAVQPGDLGMHFFVGPPGARRLRGFTRRVFRSILQFLFDELKAQRVVVEPDIRNDKIHVLNRAMGFVYQKNVQLPHKLAALAFCTRNDFLHATLKDPIE